VKLTTPAALLLGLVASGAMISFAVFFALRPTVVRAPESSSPSGAAAPHVDRAAVAREVALALEGQRAAIVTRCWDPSVTRSPTPEHVDYVLNFTFDAAGRQIARGMSEGTAAAPSRHTGPEGASRGAPSRADVTACLSMTLQPIAVTPPGASSYVEVPFGLP
jgi:hypothetical protein